MVQLAKKNLLGDEVSPYLLQHRDNPVHWRPWGPDALAEAQALDRPILLSVGYAACHWCHVMAHESFEHPATAAVMNALFVNIKVDREERPEIDQIYMNALHALGEPGGWPLTMFLTPLGEPFWGGTYFPPRALYGRPGFVQVMETIASLYRQEPDKVRQNRDALLERLSAGPRAATAGLSADLLDHAASRLLTLVDRENGGTQGAPKFPQATFLELLWRAWGRTGDPAYRDAVLTTLRQICRGGICDQVGGGFARYSVDEHWLVPHFEKMLYDNALLLDHLVRAWSETGEPLFRNRIERAIAWAEREMRSEGAFASSLDADSEGREGAFYVWRREEIDTVLGAEDGARIAALYDITPTGNFEMSNIPNLLAAGARGEDAPAPEIDALLDRLRVARDARIAPGRDDKILADWNGLMIGAMAHAGAVLARPDWLAVAAETYDRVAESMAGTGRFAHALRDGRLTVPGLATDYAAMVRAALTLHEATAEARFLADAELWVKELDAHHWSEEKGGYHLSADDADALIVRPFAAADEATPSANGLMAEALVRLHHLTGEPAYLARADRILATFTGDALANAFGHASLFNALDTRLGAVQVVLVGPDREALARAARSVPLASRIVVPMQGGALPAIHPAHGRAPLAGIATAYVCVGEACSLPITDPDALVKFLREGRRAM